MHQATRRARVSAKPGLSFDDAKERLGESVVVIAISPTANEFLVECWYPTLWCDPFEMLGRILQFMQENA